MSNAAVIIYCQNILVTTTFHHQFQAPRDAARLPQALSPHFPAPPLPQPLQHLPQIPCSRLGPRTHVSLPTMLMLSRSAIQKTMTSTFRIRRDPPTLSRRDVTWRGRAITASGPIYGATRRDHAVDASRQGRQTVVTCSISRGEGRG